MARKKVVYIEKPMNVTMYLLASLFLFLLTFFVILSSVSVMDNKRQKMAIGSVKGGFGILPGGRSPFSSTGPKNILPQSPPMERGLMDLQSIHNSLADTGIISGISVTGGRLGATITIKSPILFEGQTDVFSKDSQAVLAAIAKVISQVDNQVIITGHTDSVPVEAPPFYSNWGLSAARALAVLSYFESKGIKGSRLSAYGMGAGRPIAANSTEEGRKLNRRVEITIVGEVAEEVDLKGLKQTRGEWLRSIFYKGFNFELEEQ
jgi:chemotaxis protein MotB